MRFDPLHGLANRAVGFIDIVAVLSLDVTITQRFSGHPVLVAENNANQRAGSDDVDDLATSVCKGMGKSDTTFRQSKLGNCRMTLLEQDGARGYKVTFLKEPGF